MRISDWSSDVCSSDLLQSRSPRTLPMTPSTSVARLAASLPVAPGFAATGQAILAAANLILPDLERGRAIDARALRAAMETAFHGSDADGAWDWKTAYDACEERSEEHTSELQSLMRNSYA